MASDPEDPFDANLYDPTTVADLGRFMKFVEVAKLRIADDTATQEQVRKFAGLSMSHPAYWDIVHNLVPAMRLPHDALAPPGCSSRMVDLLGVTKQHRLLRNWTVDFYDPADVKGLVRGMIGGDVNNFFAPLGPLPDETSQAVADQIRDNISWLLEDPTTRGPPPMSVMPSTDPLVNKELLSTKEGSGTPGAGKTGNFASPLPWKPDVPSKGAPAKPAAAKTGKLLDNAAKESTVAYSETGTVNGGNTCYQNAILIALSKDPAVITALTGTENNNLNANMLNFKMLILALSDGRTQDSLKYLRQLWKDIDKLAQDNPALCTKCGKGRLARVQPDMPVTVHIPNSGKILKLEEMFPFGPGKEEILSIENNLRDVCEHTNVDEQELRHQVRTLPQKLILQIKRFSHVEGASHKLCDLVNYGLGNIIFPGGDEFRVSTIVCHVGDNTTTGHYYALTQKESGVWWRYDDDRKLEVDNLLDVITPDAVLFFVDRVSSLDEDSDMATGSRLNIANDKEDQAADRRAAGSNDALSSDEGTTEDEEGGAVETKKAAGHPDADGTTNNPNALPAGTVRAANHDVTADNGSATPPALTSNPPSVATSAVGTITQFASRPIPSWRERGAVSDSEESVSAESANVVQAAQTLAWGTPAGTWGHSARNSNSLAGLGGGNNHGSRSIFLSPTIAGTTSHNAISVNSDARSGTGPSSPELGGSVAPHTQPDRDSGCPTDNGGGEVAETSASDSESMHSVYMERQAQGSYAYRSSQGRGSSVGTSLAPVAGSSGPLRGSGRGSSSGRGAHQDPAS
ncbi:hypothetical protein OPT61_g862 [Boeremia exigua]|uniref:Uncharacterized protein n=1 Tax=Boeremia exigua TaxID=749465 RepID=A0ACC2ISE3_9PLEO|nr:hypothetical protein OPT61_g862 [Boeremia exigua]